MFFSPFSGSCFQTHTAHSNFNAQTKTTFKQIIKNYEIFLNLHIYNVKVEKNYGHDILYTRYRLTITIQPVNAEDI